MIGKGGVQPSLFDVGKVYPVRLRPGSFEVQLAMLVLLQTGPARSMWCAMRARTRTWEGYRPR